MHFLLSMLLLVACVALVWRATYEPGSGRAAPTALSTWAVRLLLLPGSATLAGGTIATAAGPHAGGEGTGDVVERDHLARRGDARLGDPAPRHDGDVPRAGGGRRVVPAALARGATPATQKAMTAVCVLLACQGFVGVDAVRARAAGRDRVVPRRARALTWLALLWAVAAGRLGRPALRAAAATRAGARARRAAQVRALVTGGAGFIGSHLVDALLDAGDEVTVVDHLDPAHAAIFEPARERGAQLVRGDVDRRRARCAQAFARGPAGGRLPPGGADRRPPLGRRPVDRRAREHRRHRGGARGRARTPACARVRAGLDRGRLRRSRRGCRRPRPRRIAPLSPVRREQGGGRDLPGAVQRACTASRRCRCGCRTSTARARTRTARRASSRSSARAARRAARRSTIFGDGRQTRDFVYVGDVVEAFVRRRPRRRQRRAQHLAPARETSAARSSPRRSGSTSAAGPARLGEISRSCLDPSRGGRSALGWRARTPLADGLERTLESLRR